MVIDKVPFDKYELEPSPLTQYILERKSPHTCWQVWHNIKKDFIMLLSFTPGGSKIIDLCHTDGYQLRWSDCIMRCSTIFAVH